MINDLRENTGKRFNEIILKNEKTKITNTDIQWRRYRKTIKILKKDCKVYGYEVSLNKVQE